MILELTLRNLALIDELRVPFRPGLNLLTGETGSGKSIIIDGMNLVLGERGSADAIREGAAQAFAEAAFDLSARPNLRQRLEAMGCECPDGILVLSREVNRNGRSLCRLNGRVSTVGQLKTIADQLVEMHGQHEHQSILQPDRQRELLDAFGGAGLKALRDQVGAAYAGWARARSALQATEAAVQADQRELDFWRFQLEEIEAAHPDPAEEETLLQERRRWQHAERLARAVGAVHDLDGDESSALHALSLAVDRFRGLEGIDPELDSMMASLTDVLLRLKDLSHAARAYGERLQVEPGQIDEIEARLHLLDRLKVKYGGSLASMLEEATRLRERLDAVANRDDRLSTLRQALADRSAELVRLAADLSRQRGRMAARLERVVERELSSLNMPRVRFKVGVDRDAAGDGIEIDGRRVRCGVHGIDRIAFLLAANPGEPLLPLDRAASGGELSRVMLALKAILADADDTPTLILDEIDTGIGGETASRLADKMQQLAGSKQVICVTHLATIAARADHHIAVSKSLRRGRHVTSVRLLSANERVDEIARLIAGERLTPAARASARELLARG